MASFQPKCVLAWAAISYFDTFLGFSVIIVQAQSAYFVLGQTYAKDKHN